VSIVHVYTTVHAQTSLFGILCRNRLFR